MIRDACNARLTTVCAFWRIVTKMRRNNDGVLRRGFVAAAGIFVFAIVAGLLATNANVLAQHRMHGAREKEDRNHPWMDAKLSPDDRAAMVLKEMTLDEKIALVHGMGMPGWPRDVQDPQPELGNGGAGFVLGVPRLGIPVIQMSDAAYGVRSSGENGRYSTALPANVAAAASWDTAGGMRVWRADRQRTARAGLQHDARRRRRTLRASRATAARLSILGEDPILAGTLVGN